MQSKSFTTRSMHTYCLFQCYVVVHITQFGFVLLVHTIPKVVENNASGRKLQAIQFGRTPGVSVTYRYEPSL